MSHRRWLHLGLAAVLVAIALSALFSVDETQYAVVTRFGRPVADVKAPGLHTKLPWPADMVTRFDRRLRLFEPGSAPYNTQDKKNFRLDLYVCWRVDDPRLFMMTVGTATAAENGLTGIVKSETATEFGSLKMDELFAVDDSEVMLEPLMAEVAAKCDTQAREAYGVEVVDVGLRRLIFPDENLESVFARMRAERQRIAKGYRAEGERQAAEIRARADKERDRILAEANRDAARTKGEADAEATRLYAAAHGGDPEFYKFMRTLEAYKKMFGDKTTVVLSADSELLQTMTGGRTDRGGQ